MAWNFEQANSIQGTTNVVAFGSNVKQGSVLIAAACVNPAAYDPTEPGAVTDTLGNTYTRLRRLADTGNAQTSVWWYAVSRAAGANSVTITAGNAVRAYLIGEWSCGSQAILEAETGQISAISTTTDSASSGSITTRGGNRLLVGFWGTTNGTLSGTLNAGTNWTERTETGQDGFAQGLCQLSDRILAAPGSVAATYTAGATSQGTAFIASFIEGQITYGGNRFRGSGLYSDPAANANST